MSCKFETVSDLAKLPKEYLLSVKGVLGSNQGQLVRFGVTGDGRIRPNYQIKYANGKSVAFNGQNHEENRNYVTYEDDNLSREFTFSEINKALNIAVLG